MTGNTNYRQLIDDFLAGRISKEDNTRLNEMLSKDPELKSEFELQNEIVNSIKDSRRLELKHRLDNININWYHTIQGGMKIAAAVSLVAVTSLSAYFYIDNQLENQNKIKLSEDVTVELGITDDSEIPDKPAAGIIEKNTIEMEAPSNDIAQTPSVQIEPESDITASIKDQQETQEALEDIEVDVFEPDVMDDFEEVEDVDMEDASNDNLNNINAVSDEMSGNMEVKTLQHKRYDFHYDLREGLLTLYGNFDDIPYEILEINSSEGRRIYLNYKDNFYHLNITSGITPLNPVRDETLINELKIVNENK